MLCTGASVQFNLLHCLQGETRSFARKLRRYQEMHLQNTCVYTLSLNYKTPMWEDILIITVLEKEGQVDTWQWLVFPSSLTKCCRSGLHLHTGSCFSKFYNQIYCFFQASENVSKPCTPKSLFFLPVIHSLLKVHPVHFLSSEKFFWLRIFLFPNNTYW